MGPETEQEEEPCRVRMLSWICTFIVYYFLFRAMDTVNEAHACRESSREIVEWTTFLSLHDAIVLCLAWVFRAYSIHMLVLLNNSTEVAMPMGADPSVVPQMETIVVDASREDLQCTICLEG